MQVKKIYKEYLNSRSGIRSYNKFKDVLYTDCDTLMQEICINIVDKIGVPDSPQICDIGGGDGTRIVNLIKHLHKRKGNKMHLDFIEQSDLMCDDFKEKSQEIRNLTDVEIYRTNIETFNFNFSYDLVLCVHSIFCLPSFDIFMRIFNNLSLGGNIIIVSNSENSFLAKLKKEIDVIYEDRRFEITDLLQGLKRNKIPYNEQCFKTEWKLTNENLQINLLIIFEWLSLGNFDQLSHAKKEYLFQFAKGMAKRGNRELTFVEDEKVIIITKK